MQTRNIQSAGLPQQFHDSPYNRPLTTGTAPDKGSILWKDFSYGIKKRKDLVRKLREAALDPNTPIILLKKTLLDVRLTTLTLIEDALEIEYRTRLSGSKQAKRAAKSGKLPPISSFRSMEDKEDVYALAEIISDVDDLFSIPNIRVMLPMSFPNSRNPFLLAKDIDELAALVPPHPEPGNAEEELKVLELLRYKRASRALIRAEAQILNRLPLEIHEVETWIDRSKDDDNLAHLLRAVCTLLDNDREDFTQEADLTCLHSPLFTVEAHELLRRLNMFKGAQPMRVDVQVAVRQQLKDCTFDHLVDPVSTFLREWTELILNASLSTLSAVPASSSNNADWGHNPNMSSRRDSPTSLQNMDSGNKRSLPPSRYGAEGLRPIVESNTAPSSSHGARVNSPMMERHLQESNGNFVGSFPFASNGAFPSREQQSRRASRDRPTAVSDDDGMASIVDEEKGYVHTHEKIFEPDVPKKKLLFRQMEKLSVMKSASVGVGPDSPTAAMSAMSIEELADTSPQQSPQHQLPDQQSNADRPAHAAMKKRKIQGEVSPMHASDDLSPLRGAGMGLKRKIRSEVEKVMRDLGIIRDKDSGGDAVDAGTMGGALSSVRYELGKMQQELLRKQVLDPRHYAVTSVDAVQHAQRGLTVSSINAFDPLDRRGRKDKIEAENEVALMPILLGEKKITVTTRHGELELTLTILQNRENKSLLCSVSCFMKAAEEHELIKRAHSLQSLNRNDDEYLELAHFELSQLMFSRLTDATYSELLDAKQNAQNRLLQNVFELLETFARQEPVPRGPAVANVNRVLFNNKFSEDNVLVDLTISRNIDCNGLVLHCVPLAGLFAKTTSIGAIVINIHDNELEVLLIGQRGLFLQSMVRWKSLEGVSQWIAGRVRIRKVAAATLVTGLANSTNHLEMTARSTESMTSQLTFTGRQTIPPAEFSLADLDAQLKAAAETPAALSSTSDPNTLLMLEVTVDRSIDISQTFLEHWKSRNIPKIVGISVALSATQDLEVMSINIEITLPNRRAFRKMMNDKDNVGVKSSLADLEDYSDDEGGGHDDWEDAQKPTQIELGYRLTRAELLAFGAAEQVEGKTVSMTKSTQANKNVDAHPEEMLWNVLNRLKVVFKGSRANPYKTETSASDSSNWELHFDRLLHRDVKTVSQHVLMLSLSTIGGDLLIEPEPVDKNSKVMVLAKRLPEAEITALVNSEGWPGSLCEYTERRAVAKMITNKLKVVPCDNSDAFQLELYTFVETRMIVVTRVASRLEPELELGAVEINSHHTLGDLRIIMKHEFDEDDLPTQYRFIYKGQTCSLRQESFRRAWECLPYIYIVPKDALMTDMGVETEDIELKRQQRLNALNGKGKDKGDDNGAIPKLLKGQRRVPGRYYAIPVNTLCIVLEQSNLVFTLHDAGQLLVPGDIIRIGGISGRDYVVQSVGLVDENDQANGQILEIFPPYDIAAEPDMRVPLMKNFAFPDSPYCGMYFFEYREHIRLLKTPQELGHAYLLNKDMKKLVDPSLLVMDDTKDKTTNAAELDDQSMSSKSTLTSMKSAKSMKIQRSQSFAQGTAGADKSPERNEQMLGEGNGSPQKPVVPLLKTQKSTRSKSKLSTMMYGSRVFVDCWLWKCLPGKVDPRPKWRQLYDNGEIIYNYEFRESEEYFTFFRVKALYGYVEVLCTDARVPQLTYHNQRVNEMKHITMDQYLKLIFEKMTEWTPQYKRGIERTKFIKLVKDTVAFPDLKRPARVAQIDMYFAKYVKMPEYGIVQKYLNYNGLVTLIKQIAVIRFPPPRKPKEGEGDDGDDDKSITSQTSLVDDKKAPVNAIAEAKKAAGNKKGNRRDQPEEDDRLVLKNVDPQHILNATQRLILEYFMMYPGWYESLWREAKLVSMEKEARIYCAATRIAALSRGHRWKKKYHEFIRTHTILQANIRRKLSDVKVRLLLRKLYEDWCFRERYRYARMIQCIIRRFLKIRWYKRMIEQKKKQEIILCKARRQKRKKHLQKTRKPVMYKEVKRVNGVTLVITITRNDPRSYTRDFGMIIYVYIPDTQDVFTFALSDSELREYMALLLEVSVVSAGQLTDRRNLQKLLSVRLIVHKASQKHDSPVVIFSKHALGQKGEHAFTRAKRISNEFFVCKIFETVADIAVQMYHRLSCKVFNLSMEKSELFPWIKDDFIAQYAELLANAKSKAQKKLQGSEPAHKSLNGSSKRITNGSADSLTKASVPDTGSTEMIPGDEVAISAQDLPIFHPRNKQALYYWLLEHIVVDKRKGLFKPSWSISYDRSHKREMLIRIQSLWRRALVRPFIIHKLDKFMLKVRASPNPEDGRAYYLNVNTGASSWHKPFLLGPYDLTAQPTRRWVPVYYEHQGMQYVHYVNPYTGKYTHFSTDQAVRKMQSLVRNFLLKTIRMTREGFSKSVKIFLEAQAAYEAQSQPPRKLASVINYALVLHAVKLDEALAKDVYREAVELSEANPLVTRAYAFFLLGTCESPINLNRDRAVTLLMDAKRKDPEHHKFSLAYNLFQLAVLRTPRDHRALLNLALIQCLLYNYNFTAEKLFRRALAYAPFDERTIELWKYVKDRFPERHIVYNPLSRVHRAKVSMSKDAKLRTVHGRPVMESNLWAGWMYVPDDPYSIAKTIPKGVPYWYNPADGTESLDAPDFEEQWRIRMARSHMEEDEHGLQQFFDPLTSEYFTFHPLTSTFA